jgi:hypothetical protein
MAVRCAWCGRYRLDDVWVEIEEPPDPLRTSHGVCPDCFDDLVAIQHPSRRTSLPDAHKAAS